LFEQGYLLTNVYFSLQQTTGIQSAIRQQKQQGGGNLLKAEVGNGQADRGRVTFTGTRTNDKGTGITYERVSDKLDLIP